MFRHKWQVLIFKISDIIFSLHYSEYDNINKDMFIETYLYNCFSEYQCEKCKMHYHIKFTQGVKFVENGKLISSGWYNHVYKDDNIVRIAFHQPKREQSPYYTYSVDITNDWKNAEIIDYITKEERFSKTPHIGFTIGLYLYIQSVILRHDSFFLHGVALQYRNKNIVFSAGSGVGKTTHTNFWKNKFGAEILNGDSPIIKFVDGVPYIYGSPWCGTSEITVNRNVPLDAIVILSRGNENKISKLSRSEGIKYLFPHIRRPVWDIELTNICLDYCEKIADTVSIYKLECLPDEESAEIALAGIKELHE